MLKPQREGGGNNIYGYNIPSALRVRVSDKKCTQFLINSSIFHIKDMPKSEWEAYILMERIFPPISKGYMIRPGGTFPPPLVDMVSELGIFGAIIG